MNHDVFVCYDEEDKACAEAVCDILEENNIKTWIRSRDISSNDTVVKLTEAISNSKCFLLLYSKNAKNTNYIINETDIAFSNEIPILLFKLDDSGIPKDLEFILISARKVLAYPDSKKQLKSLVKEASDIIGEPIDNVKLDSKSVKTIEKSNPKRNEHLMKKAVMAAIPIAIALILIYLFVIAPMGQNTTPDGIFIMNITDVDIAAYDGGYKYTLYGESYNLPSDPERYVMNIRFLDKNDNMVYEVNRTADEFNSGIIWSGDLKDDSTTHIALKLTDLEDKIYSEQNYKI